MSRNMRMEARRHISREECAWQHKDSEKRITRVAAAAPREAALTKALKEHCCITQLMPRHEGERETDSKCRELEN